MGGALGQMTMAEIAPQRRWRKYRGLTETQLEMMTFSASPLVASATVFMTDLRLMVVFDAHAATLEWITIDIRYQPR
jgi:hypothetical protein